MKYLMILLTATMILSCNPSKKLDKIYSKHPELLANFCKDTFPCIATKIDTLTKVEYDFIELQCPGYDYDNALLDTVWLTHSKTQLINGPAVLVTEVKTNTITKQIKDSAEIKSCELDVLLLNKKISELNEKNNKLQNKVTTKNRLIMWLIIALLCSILCNILQLKK